MLHVWWASGEKLAALPGGEVHEVRSLKQRLQKLCGVSRFRQRLLHDGVQLGDGIVLQSPMDIQLVVLPFAQTSYLQAYRLLEECASGDTLALEASLQRPQDPNFTLGKGPLLPGQTRMYLVWKAEHPCSQLLRKVMWKLPGCCVQPVLTRTPLPSAVRRRYSQHAGRARCSCQLAVRQRR